LGVRKRDWFGPSGELGMWCPLLFVAATLFFFFSTAGLFGYTRDPSNILSRPPISKCPARKIWPPTFAPRAPTRVKPASSSNYRAAPSTSIYMQMTSIMLYETFVNTCFSFLSFILLSLFFLLYIYYNIMSFIIIISYCSYYIFLTMYYFFFLLNNKTN
jgi:hypothetical protein